MLIDHVTTGPSAEQVARRLIILKHVVSYALVAPPREMLTKLLKEWGDEERQAFFQDVEDRRETFWKGLRGSGFWQELSPQEQAFAQSTLVTMSEQQQVEASWRMEAAQVLMWALNVIGDLPPWDTQADHDLLKKLPPPGVSAFVASACLRHPEEIHRARDTAEFWHWRSRTRQLIERGDTLEPDESMKAAGFHTYDDIVRFSARKAAEEGTLPLCIDDDFPAKRKAYRSLSDEEWSEVRSVTAERHFALNWLCGYAPGNFWDETPTET